MLTGRSHTFISGGAQAAKITSGPFCPKKWGGPNATFTIVQAKNWG